jgi:hypothetical protein
MDEVRSERGVMSMTLPSGVVIESAVPERTKPKTLAEAAAAVRAASVAVGMAEAEARELRKRSEAAALRCREAWSERDQAGIDLIEVAERDGRGSAQEME